MFAYIWLVGSCDDGVRNQDETARDCGGVCPACRVRKFLLFYVLQGIGVKVIIIL